MDNEQLILSALLRVENRIGGLESSVKSYNKKAEDQDVLIAGHGRSITFLNTFVTKFNARVGVIAVIFSSAGTLGMWLLEHIFSKPN